MNKLSTYFISLIALISANVSFSQELISEKEKKQINALFKTWNKNDSPGASVAVVKNNQIIYKNAFGIANLEYNVEIAPTTIFHIASVSKQFSVFSILLLEAEGKLDLEDDIRMYIPEVPDFGYTITLKNLASHTSGLRDQWNLLALAGWRLDDVITKEHIFKLVEKQEELNFKPGEEFLYCNTGFTLLAEVVARVSGQTFAEYTAEKIFEPLGMKNTLFYDDHEKIVKNRAYSYKANNSGFKKSVLNYANVGATSLFTTTEDLALWAMNFSNPKVGSSAIFMKMNKPIRLNSGKETDAALGQFVGSYRGVREIKHGGTDAGYRAHLARYPDQGYSIIVFSNLGNFRSGEMAHKIADIILNQYLEKELKPQSEVKESISSKPINKALLDKYIGSYELQPGYALNIRKEDDSLFLKVTGQDEVPMTRITNTRFDVKDFGFTIVFEPQNGESISAIKLFQGEEFVEAKRINEFTIQEKELSEYLGQYYSSELSTYYNLELEEGQIVLKHQRNSDITLNPLKKDVFAGDAWFLRQLEFTRNSEGKIIGFKVSSGRVRNLIFRKLL